MELWWLMRRRMFIEDETNTPGAESVDEAYKRLFGKKVPDHKASIAVIDESCEPAYLFRDGTYICYSPSDSECGIVPEPVMLAAKAPKLDHCFERNCGSNRCTCRCDRCLLRSLNPEDAYTLALARMYTWARSHPEPIVASAVCDAIDKSMIGRVRKNRSL
jgi:hypothetical protein